MLVEMTPEAIYCVKSCALVKITTYLTQRLEKSKEKEVKRERFLIYEIKFVEEWDLGSFESVWVYCIWKIGEEKNSAGPIKIIFIPKHKKSINKNNGL